MEAQLDRANENVRLLFNRIVLETEKLSMDHVVQGYFLVFIRKKKRMHI